jgi:hypothetical protein
MQTPRSRHAIRIGEHLVLLPRGVTIDQWALEKTRWQNPRIRAFLGCIQLLESVLDSNFAILHCSPERLDEIWSKVQRVSEAIEKELIPLLKAESKVQGLEQARERAQTAAEILHRQTLKPLQQFPADLPPEGLLELRKSLCTAIGKIYAFLQDAFGDIMTNDPRSRYDADYFLSRRFHRDMEEAEWLYRSVDGLQAYVQGLENPRKRKLVGLAALLRESGAFPEPHAWSGTAPFLDELLSVLTPKLKQILTLQGVRFEELEVVDRYASDIPAQCQLLQTLYEVGRDSLDQIAEEAGESWQEQAQSRRDQDLFARIMSLRLADNLDRLSRPLQDLTAFVPLWREGISKRRALLFHNPSPELPNLQAKVSGEAAQAEEAASDEAPRD